MSGWIKKYVMDWLPIYLGALALVLFLYAVVISANRLSEVGLKTVVEDVWYGEGGR